MRYSEPLTQPPESTIPKPNMTPPTTVAMPSGRMCASEGSTPEPGLGITVAMIIAKPAVATARPAMMPRIIRPWRMRIRSRNPATKQKRLRWQIAPKATPVTQNTGHAASTRSASTYTTASPTTARMPAPVERSIVRTVVSDMGRAVMPLMVT